MPRYVALLRGINVGGNKRIAMADLRSLLSDLGYGDVVTHLQSGNAVFSGPDAPTATVAGRIADGIADVLGLSVRCLVRTGAELRAVAAGNPLSDVAADGSRMLALFLSETPHPALLAAHDPTALAPAQVRLGDRVIYQWCPDGVLAAPPVSGFVEKHLGVAVTARNWNTVSKLTTLVGG
ncbi:DUF1697 domain-containing protein [Planosporangium sp. 12N6]|uniref:DUF1697 domain-containing protein n=1 Tax=Planosporangium spinosum TaxID=3402278 RepID=UPI003CE78BAF